MDNDSKLAAGSKASHDTRPVVLMLEPDAGIQRICLQHLEGENVRLVFAVNLNEARALFKSTPNIALITTVGRISLSSTDSVFEFDINETVAFIEEIAAQFKKPIIAASGNPVYTDALMKAGCTVRCDDKWHLPELILERV